jgi:aminoglycoside phosphotransferase family enzyme/predicted kinase
MTAAASASNGTEETGTQRRVAAFLRRAETYGPQVSEVEEITTHISRVFLAGDRVYKMKRAVEFAYCDFSTLEKRRAACERELELNRRTAPELYLDVIPVLRVAEGGFRLGGPEDGGEVVEWLVLQRRFDQEALLDRMAAEGSLGEQILISLGTEIAAFHAKAQPTPGYGGAKGIAWVIQENAEEWGKWPDLFEPKRATALDNASREALEELGDLLDRRREACRVRRCHGDLHLRNIVLLDGRPRLFDAIEFNDRLACIDTLYDLAFLLMDLECRDQRAGANLVMNRVVQAEDDLEGLAALPLFLSLRAAVRAKIGATVASGLDADEADKAESQRAEARRYFAAAEAYLTPGEPVLVAVGGLSGTGKTTQARRVAPGLGPAPGAVHLRSDAIRKELAGVPEDRRLPESAYSPEKSAEVYAAIYDRAERALRAGHAVVADAVFGRPEERSAIADVARSARVEFRGLWLDASREAMERRVSGRSGDASDATVEVVRTQLAYELGPIDWARIDADGAPAEVAVRIRARLGIDS